METSDGEALRASLDRFLQSETLREARDIVGAAPLLLGAEVSAYLSEAAKQSRQIGDVQMAGICEYRLNLLRIFREFGLQNGFFELSIEALVRAQNPAEHEAVMRNCPELREEAGRAFISQRISESKAVVDAAAVGKYTLAESLAAAKSFACPDGEVPETTEAVNTFIHGFIHERDATARRRLLEERPALLEEPQSLIVGSIFQPYIERARTRNDFVVLRELLLGQALFAQCRKVGIAGAFQELADGVIWNQLKQT